MTRERVIKRLPPGPYDMEINLRRCPHKNKGPRTSQRGPKMKIGQWIVITHLARRVRGRAKSENGEIVITNEYRSQPLKKPWLVMYIGYKFTSSGTSHYRKGSTCPVYKPGKGREVGIISVAAFETALPYEVPWDAWRLPTKKEMEKTPTYETSD